jgi:hypothetical protein
MAANAAKIPIDDVIRIAMRSIIFQDSLLIVEFEHYVFCGKEDVARQLEPDRRPDAADI